MVIVLTCSFSKVVWRAVKINSFLVTDGDQTFHDFREVFRRVKLARIQILDGLGRSETRDPSLNSVIIPSCVISPVVL
jgi:hypothetical protein